MIVRMQRKGLYWMASTAIVKALVPGSEMEEAYSNLERTGVLYKSSFRNTATDEKLRLNKPIMRLALPVTNGMPVSEVTSYEI